MTEFSDELAEGEFQDAILAHMSKQESDVKPPAPTRRKSDDNDRVREDDPYAPVKFGEFGMYMRHKRRKLDIQNDAMRDRDVVQRPQIFAGLAIYVSHALSLSSCYKLNLMIAQWRYGRERILGATRFARTAWRTLRSYVMPSITLTPSKLTRVESVPRQEEPRHAHRRFEPDTFETRRVQSLQSGDPEMARRFGPSRQTARLAKLCFARLRL